MTPHQNRPKTPKSSHKKLKKLKKRLQYKKNPEPPQNVEDEIASDNEENAKAKQEFFNRASPMRIVKLYKHQNDSHRHIISLNGFGSFLRIKCSKLHPGLCNFLMESFNFETCELEFPGRGSIPITEALVEKVLGLPNGEIPVVYQTNEEAIAFVMLTLGFGDGHQPKLADVTEKLESMELGDPRYLMMWLVYVVCSMLAPTTGIHISPRIYPTIMDPTKIKLLNWCRFVILILIETAKAKDKKNQFKACMSFLMIGYIDSLETRGIAVEKEGPRICAWDNKSVANAIAQDTKPDGTFGLLPLNKIYRQNKVLKLSTPAKIENFVKANVPPNCGEEEMSRYITATREMYSEIDVAVAKFLKIISQKPQQSEKPQQPEKPQQSEKPQRRQKTLQPMKPQEQQQPLPPQEPKQTKVSQKLKAKVVCKRKRPHHDQINDPSCSRRSPRISQFRTLLPSSSSNTDSDSDGDYIQHQSGYQTDHVETSLDDESFGCKDSDDDFTSTCRRKRDQNPLMQSRWLRQSGPEQVKPSVPRKRMYKTREASNQKVTYTEARPLQIRDPQNIGVQHNASSKPSSNADGATDTIRDVHPPRKGGATLKRKGASSSNTVVHKKARADHDDQNNQIPAEKAQVTATQIGTIGTQGNQEEGVQVESRAQVHGHVLPNPLENIKLYGSDSESDSSNDNLETETQTAAPSDIAPPMSVPAPRPTFAAAPPTVLGDHAVSPLAPTIAAPKVSAPALTIVPTVSPALETITEDIRSCLKRGKVAGKSAHIAGDVGEQCTLISSTNAHVSDGIPAQLMKKSVSWALDPTHVSDAIPAHCSTSFPNSEDGASKLLQSHSEESPAKERPVTRSVSPLKQMLPAKEATSPVTRSISSANPMILLNEGLSKSTNRSPMDSGSSSKQKSRASRLPKTKDEVTPQRKPSCNIMGDSMSRKLDFGSIEQNIQESRYVVVDAPSFELGLDDSPNPEEVTQEVYPTTGLPEITTSNEDQFYGPAEEYEKLWDKYGENLLPTDNCSSVPGIAKEVPVKSDATPHNTLGKEVAPIVDAAHDPDSKTPVPQPHQKRIIRPAKSNSSPYVLQDLQKENNFAKNTFEIYNAVCKHGAKSESKLKKKVIIDCGQTFVYLGDLADSVAPNGWLSNSTCELGLHVLAHEMAAQKKFVMPLVIANKLREHSFNTKDVKRVFAFSQTHRLYHKEQIMFPVLQNLSSVKDIFTGHYYLINLNLKAERFEVMDSLRKPSDKSLIADSTTIINSVKSLWSSKYKLSNIKIENYETVHVPVPKQLTTFDCGYFVLKFIECWDGRKMMPINPVLMSSFRITLTKKWLEWSNKISWFQLLFGN